jgi:drug/metabolite transporter (DMT)-like permease
VRLVIERRADWVGWLALVCVYVVWGSTYLAIRVMVGSVPPLAGAAVRYLLAGVLLAVIVLARGGWAALRMSRAELGTSALVGVLMPAMGNGLVTVAEVHVSSGLAALLVASVPLFVLLIGMALGRRPSVLVAVGIVIGFLGLAGLLLADPGASPGVRGATWWGPWLVLLAAFGWSAGTVAATRLPTPSDALAMTTVEMLAGGVVLLLGSVVVGERVDVGAISGASGWALAYLVVAGSVVALSAYAVALRRLPLSTVSTYAYVNPVVAVLLGVWFAGERFGGMQLLGGALVVAAVALVISEPVLARRRALARG